MISFDSEKALEDFVCQNLERKFNIITEESVISYVRQPNLGLYGKGDILTISSEEDVSLFELKNEELKISHISQIAKYRKFFMNHDSEFERRNYEFALVVKKSAAYSGDMIFLANQVDWLSVYEFSLDPAEGICFSLINEYSPNGDMKQNAQAINLLGLPEILQNGVPF